MRRLTLFIVALFSLVSASAQQSKTDESVEFRPHWDLQLQAGAAYTIGESSTIGKLTSPALYLSTNYRFHSAMGVRLGVGGWQGRGMVLLPQHDYAFKFMQLNADYKLDLTTLIGGYNHSRLVSVYAMAGAGLNYSFNNNEAALLASNAQMISELEYLWDSKLFIAGRFGVGVDFRVGERLLIGVEANANILSDRFNSKRAENVDWHTNLMAGISYSFGMKHRPSSKWIAEQEAMAAAELLRAEQEAEAQRQAREAEEQRLAAEEAERQRIEAEEQAAAEARRLAAERLKNISDNSDNANFIIGSAEISEAEAKRVRALAEWLVAHEGYRVSIVGYADRETGTAEGNMRLSERRARNVMSMLVDLGVDNERITMNFVGDTEQPFERAEDNRVVIFTLE